MAIATYKDLCLDAVDVGRYQAFWATVLGLTIDDEPGHQRLIGQTDQHRVWINQVPETKSAKNRVHLDVHAGSVEELLHLGATHVADFPEWTVLADPDGQEFCAFIRQQVPAYRLYEIVVDAADPGLITRWWAGVLGATVGVPESENGTEGEDWYLENIPGAPFEAIVFEPVPEPKTVKNRVHWDVTVTSIAEILDAGAKVLRERDADIGWWVLADPQGNEFCVFTTETDGSS